MHIFESVDEAIFQLTSHSQNFQFPTRQNLVTPNDIIKFSVQQNIFRALGLHNHKPSDVYRNWATTNFENLHTRLTNCQNVNEFDLIIESFTDSFLISWCTTTNEKLVYGPASKIVNLLIKAMQESNQYKVDSIIRLQHVPWDSYTLRPLRNIINVLTDITTTSIFRLLRQCLLLTRENCTTYFRMPFLIYMTSFQDYRQRFTLTTLLGTTIINFCVWKTNCYKNWIWKLILHI